MALFTRKNKISKQTLSPWIEKYRPKLINDIIFQDEVVSILKRCIETKNFPNSLFFGPPGTGKTSAILAVVREKIKKFSKLGINKIDNVNKIAPFKLVILDEADSMTSTAQAALRRIMEKEIKTTRFCIICNYISRIIDPLASRCTKFRFKPLSSEIVKNQLNNISQKENIKIENSALNLIYQFSQGDLRKAIMYLHTGSLFVINKDSLLTEKDISEICGIIPSEIFEELLEGTKHKIDQLLEKIKNFMKLGYSTLTLLNMLSNWTLETNELSDIAKSKILEQISMTDYMLNQGADDQLQIMAIFSKIMSVRAI